MASVVFRSCFRQFCCKLPARHYRWNSSLPTRSMEFAEVVKRLNTIAPLHLAGSWDNVGLLVEPSFPQPNVERILLTNDLTEAVLEEALSLNVNLIYCYHPVIFSPLKRLTNSLAKDRVVVKAVEQRIGIYCPHTALDAVEGGVNDWLISGLGAGQIRPLNRASCRGKVVQIDIEDKEKAIALRKEMEEMPGVRGVSLKTFVEESQIKNELDLRCSNSAVSDILQNVSSKFGQGVEVKVFDVETLPEANTGIGRILTLHEPTTLNELVTQTKRHLGVEHVRLAASTQHGSNEKVVTTVAVCAGSGGKVLSGVPADVYVSGEMSHHEVLAAVGGGHSVILCEHSNTERGFLQTLLPKLLSLLNQQVAVHVSKMDADPLKVV